MLKSIVAVSALLTLGFLQPAPGLAETHTKTATLDTSVHKAATGPVGHEFLAPFSTLYGKVKFTDDGTTLTVNGTASGFNPGLSYTSFFYGTGSVPRGALACFPPTPNNLTATQMITAYWLPVTGYTRTLYVQKTGTSYLSLAQASTFSIRYDSTPTLPLATNLGPGRYWLDSCGYIF